MTLIVRWLISAASLAVTAWLLPGIHVTGQNGVTAVLIMAIVLGLVNAVVRPVLQLLSCGLLILTLGLFTFVINAAMLALASWISVNWFGAGFSIDSFGSALLGSIVVSIVSFLLSLFVGGDRLRRV